MTDAIDAVDRDALERAMVLARREPDRAEQLDALLAQGDSWGSVARFAAYLCQCRTMHLKPWESPPMHADSPTAAQLADRLVAAGLSVYEPDPLRALEPVCSTR
jgi:hypothetical protein